MRLGKLIQDKELLDNLRKLSKEHELELEVKSADFTLKLDSSELLCAKAGREEIEVDIKDAKKLLSNPELVKLGLGLKGLAGDRKVKVSKGFFRQLFGK